MSSKYTYEELNERHKKESYEKRRVIEKHIEQLYWFTLPQWLCPVFLATLARKIALSNNQLYMFTIKNTSCTLQDKKTPLNIQALQPQIFIIHQH